MFVQRFPLFLAVLSLSLSTFVPQLASVASAEEPEYIAYLEGLKGRDKYIAPSQIDPAYETAIYVNVATYGKQKQRMWVLHRDLDKPQVEVAIKRAVNPRKHSKAVVPRPQENFVASNTRLNDVADLSEATLATSVQTEVSTPKAEDPVQLPMAHPWKLGMHDKKFWSRKKGKPSYSWPVSSGRVYPGEKFAGPTPTGVFNLDERRGRLARGYYSAGMYDAMFIDLHYSSGRRSGVALHGTSSSKYRKLGRADSHGCIRMHRTNSRALYDRVTGRDKAFPQSKINGTVPRFFKSSTKAKTRRGYNRAGKPILDKAGEPLVKDGYKTLIVFFKHSG